MTKLETLRGHLEPFVGLKVREHRAPRDLLWKAFCRIGHKIQKLMVFADVTGREFGLSAIKSKMADFNRGQQPTPTVPRQNSYKVGLWALILSDILLYRAN